MFKLEIDTDNTAFEPSPNEETARILREIATTLDSGHMSSHGQTVRDINGNTVGSFYLRPSRADEPAIA